MILVIFLKVVADDEGRRHVDEARADAVQETVREEQPLRRLYERRSDTADRQDTSAEQAADAETAMTEHPDKSDRQRCTRQRYTERERSDPI